ncbi:MAG: hypothetical protein AB7P17_02160 [Nitrospirales bacterium]|nr:hypothetical protein [Nitrospirales bacterium]
MVKKDQKCRGYLKEARPWSPGVFVLAWFFVHLGQSIPVEAVVQNPSPKQLEEALMRGAAIARERQPPINLYAHFGRSEGFKPHGFLMTKLGGVAVLAGHFALRGEKPSSEDIERILAEETLQIVVTVFGDTPIFARESYLLLQQGENLIKPTRIRADGRATAIDTSSNHPTFRAKIVASFAYGTFAPEAETVISVFPGVGGEVSFLLNFSSIP